MEVDTGEDVGVALADAVPIGVSVDTGIKLGQASNSQLGPLLPTLVPSSQILASVVQATGFSVLFIYMAPITYATTARSATTPNTTATVIIGDPLFGPCAG